MSPSLQSEAPAEFGPAPGMVVPQPAATRGVAVVVTASPDGANLIYTNGSNVIIRSLAVRAFAGCMAPSLAGGRTKACRLLLLLHLRCLLLPTTTPPPPPLLSSSLHHCNGDTQDPSLVTVYSGHAAAVKVAKFSPSGKWVASGGA